MTLPGQSAPPAPPAPPAAAAGVRHQLWVRIYPDDCSIDTFEPMLSLTELANAQRYWRQLWSAGGLEDGERAAWRALVAAHGSGRAGWIVDTYQPVNLAQRPSKAAADGRDPRDLDADPAGRVRGRPRSRTTGSRCGGPTDDLGAQQQARAALDARRRRGPCRSAHRRLRAVQPDRQAGPACDTHERRGADRVRRLRRRPADDPAVVVARAPGQAASPIASSCSATRRRRRRSRRSGTRSSCRSTSGPTRRPIRTPIRPERSTPTARTCSCPDELKWMIDFERAVAVGMGIAVDLTPAQARAGFDRLLVLGLELSASDTDGKAGARGAAPPPRRRPDRALAGPAGDSDPQHERPGDRVHAARQRRPELR